MKFLINTYLFEEYIERENIDETEFCIRAKLPKDVYFKILNNDYDFSAEYIFTISNALNIKPHQLFIPTLRDLK